MADRIEPALTPEQWAKEDAGHVWVEREAPPAGLGINGQWNSIPANMLPAAIALANAALPDGDKRKITRQWIADLDWVLQHNGGSGDYLRSVEDVLRPIRDALESYLPPERP